MRPRPNLLTGDRRGTATIEFALLTSMLFAVVLAALDYGMFFVQRSNLASAVATAGVHSFGNRGAVSFANIPAVITAGARAPAGTGMAISVQCNGTASPCVNTDATTGTQRACACLTTANSFVAASSCGAACTGTNMTADSTAGYYMAINASYRYRPIVLPGNAIKDAVVRQVTIVRLQ